MATIQTSLGTVTYPNTVGSQDRPVVAKAWEKGDKVRVYFSVPFGSGSVDCGYYDCSLKMDCIKSRPVNFGQCISAGVSFEPSTNARPIQAAPKGRADFYTRLGGDNPDDALACFGFGE